MKYRRTAGSKTDSVGGIADWSLSLLATYGAEKQKAELFASYCVKIKQK